MKKKMVFILGLCLLLSGFMNVAGAEEKNLTAEDVIKMLQNKPKVSVYTEVEITSYNPNDKTTTIIKSKHWDDTKNGNYKSERTNGKKTSYSVSTNGKNIIYHEGDRIAIEYNAPVSFVGAHDKDYNLKKLLATTDVSYKGEEKVNGRLAYHLYGKGKKFQVAVPVGSEKRTITRTYPDMEIWFDAETGIVIRSKMKNNELNVTKVTVSPKFSKETFSLHLPSGVQLMNIDDLQKE